MNFQPSGKAAVQGWAAAFLMVLIGTGWQLVTRAGARAALAPVDLALLRYAIPALLLAPLWWRSGLLPAGTGRWRLAFIVAGAGLPFGLLAMGGARLAPVAHMGALLPGASPMLVMLLGWLWLGARAGRAQAAGLGLLGLGIALITHPSWGAAQGRVWLGDLLFCGAALLWALYTLALRGSGLSPWQSAAVVSAWSALGVIPLWCMAYFSGLSQMATAGAGPIAVQAIWQGLIAGVGGLAVFGFAIRQIGPQRATSVGALVPALVAVGGWVLLDEALDAAAWPGVVAVVAGVWLASRASPVDARAASRGA